MNQPIEDPQPSQPRLVRHRVIGFSNASLLIAAANFVFWIVLLLPLYAATEGSSNNDGLRFLIVFFIVTDLLGLSLASTAIYKSRLRKTMASYGFILNVAMIGLNLSIFPY